MLSPLFETIPSLLHRHLSPRRPFFPGNAEQHDRRYAKVLGLPGSLDQVVNGKADSVPGMEGYGVF